MGILYLVQMSFVKGIEWKVSCKSKVHLRFLPIDHFLEHFQAQVNESYWSGVEWIP